MGYIWVYMGLVWVRVLDVQSSYASIYAFRHGKFVYHGVGMLLLLTPHTEKLLSVYYIHASQKDSTYPQMLWLSLKLCLARGKAPYSQAPSSAEAVRTVCWTASIRGPRRGPVPTSRTLGSCVQVSLLLIPLVASDCRP